MPEEFEKVVDYSLDCNKNVILETWEACFLDLLLVPCNYDPYMFESGGWHSSSW